MHVILIIVIVSILSQIAHAAPGLRSRRADVGFDEIGAVDSSDLNPVELEVCYFVSVILNLLFKCR